MPSECCQHRALKTQARKPKFCVQIFTVTLKSIWFYRCLRQQFPSSKHLSLHEGVKGHNDCNIGMMLPNMSTEFSKHDTTRSSSLKAIQEILKVGGWYICMLLQEKIFCPLCHTFIIQVYFMP
ncbi:hypothetical protein OUZ56_003792 [Daphnia magna]|uniref:Uncharacterized protein n=1 Tax=Daphnia magna TaxID=35525 RepID=A0ABQ9YMT6_9CRUS|nr:hypothetical protein OUZ56_003792 [Daphnia magna]